MSENYKFFQHKSCEYFPCHSIENIEKFNCLFCYCPLYFLKDCGGANITTNNIKNCTNCLVPHLENGYEYIINKIIKKNSQSSR